VAATPRSAANTVAANDGCGSSPKTLSAKALAVLEDILSSKSKSPAISAIERLKSRGAAAVGCGSSFKTQSYNTLADPDDLPTAKGPTGSACFLTDRTIGV
jgi:hypothetical protein